MELYRKVRLACRDGMSERAAARHFGVSRQSVRKMLQFSVPPGYRCTAPVRRPKLDEFTGLIEQWLEDDRRHGYPKQRHTAKRIFERLRDEHDAPEPAAPQVKIGEQLRVSGREHDAAAKLGMRVVDTSVRQRDHRAGRESARGMGNAHAHVVNAPAESSRRKHRDEET